jgi:acyl carrier protein
MAQLTTDEVRTTLSDIWVQVVHKRPQDENDFFELGGGSMELIQLMIAVQERFGIGMSVDEFFIDGFTFGRCVSAVTSALELTAVAAQPGLAPSGPAK